MENRPLNILLIEDSLIAVRHFENLLKESVGEEFAAKLTCGHSLSEGLRRLNDGGSDIILLDLTLPDAEGFEAFNAVKEQSSNTPILIMAGLEDEALAMKAVQNGAQDYLIKGTMSSDMLRRSIRYAIERNRTKIEILQLNRVLEQRLTELQGLNRELESFSHSVSHDLQAPLRAIDGFSRILLKDYTDKLDDEGKRLLNIIQTNTDRMGQLIRDILAFSRSGRQEMRKIGIDMGHLIKAVFDELKTLVPERKIQLKMKPLPLVRGDRPLIRVALTNLLSNAVKFTGPRETAVIEVGVKARGGRNWFYIRDNGVGFDMRYADNLFSVFHRLHGADEFEGTGIGLAIVQRIIHRHGGQVQAQGKLDQGATFYFTLPQTAEG